MRPDAPGSYAPLRDRWRPFAELARDLPRDALVVIDEKVAKLHPEVRRALRARAPRALVEIKAGEAAKTLAHVQALLEAGRTVTRRGTVMCVGGGTLGDLCTVVAHLLKRGVTLIHVPSTLLAAVDSSVGGKGAVHVRGAGGRAIKNAAGVFHYADQSWLCPELFDTLSGAQLREGATEAWKMALCLDPKAWRRLVRGGVSLGELVQRARTLKDRVCASDPYEQRGVREVLNFGHTFGHVLESVSGFRLSHGDAVGIGMLCALDVGRKLRVTPAGLAEEVEAALVNRLGIRTRAVAASYWARARPAQLAELIHADKKTGSSGLARMVLLRGLGRTAMREVPTRTWQPLVDAWAKGRRP